MQDQKAGSLCSDAVEYENMRRQVISQQLPKFANDLFWLQHLYERLAREYAKTQLLFQLNTTQEEFYEVGVLLQVLQARQKFHTANDCTGRYSCISNIDEAHEILVNLPQDYRPVQELLGKVDIQRKSLHRQYAWEIVQRLKSPDYRGDQEEYKRLIRSIELSECSLEHFGITRRDLKEWSQLPSILQPLRDLQKIARWLRWEKRFPPLRWIRRFCTRHKK